MTLSRNQSLFVCVIGSLLALWALFGCLELAETVASMDQLVSEDQEEQDADQDALAQLAYGLRSDSSSVEIAVSSPVIDETPTELSPLATTFRFELNRRNHPSPPSLLIHQRISVYRI